MSADKNEPVQTTPDAYPLRKVLRAHGVESAPKDHWIYAEGASATLLPTRSRKPSQPGPEAPTNSVFGRVRPELRDLVRHEVRCSAEDIPSDTELEDGEAIDWVASNYIDELLVNVFRASCSGEPTVYFAVNHGDGGAAHSWKSPWRTLDEAKASFGTVPERWTDIG